MNVRTGSLLAFALLTLTATLRAQSVDPSGHWQGALSSPQGELRFDVDLQQTADGALGGSIDIPGQRIEGLPLRDVTVQGAAIEFSARSDQGFRGDIAADGQTILGTFTIEGNSLPFLLKRAGAARVRPALTGTPLPPALEGLWHATVNGGSERVVLRLANEAGGSVAMLTNLDEGGLRIPGAAGMNGTALTVRFPAIDGSYVATLNGDATELVGTYTQGDASGPMTFRRQ